MKAQYLNHTLKVAAITAAIACVTALATAATKTEVLKPAGETAGAVRFVRFNGSPEADLLRHAYHTLATGDHDYKGHRVHAMHAVEAAGKLLGMDLAGDLKDRSPQVLSDDKMREASGMLEQVLGAAEVKAQKGVTKHLKMAINQINAGLAVK